MISILKAIYNGARWAFGALGLISIFLPMELLHGHLRNVIVFWRTAFPDFFSLFHLTLSPNNAITLSIIALLLPSVLYNFVFGGNKESFALYDSLTVVYPNIYAPATVFFIVSGALIVIQGLGWLPFDFSKDSDASPYYVGYFVMTLAFVSAPRQVAFIMGAAALIFFSNEVFVRATSGELFPAS